MADTTKVNQGAALDEIKRVPLSIEYWVFLGLAVLLLVIGGILAPSVDAVIEGYKTILTHPSLIDFDGFAWAGNFGTPFINAGIMTLLVLLVYKLTNTDLQGVPIAAMMMVVGFAFYGKNPMNVWFPLIGVFAHTLIMKKPLGGASALAWFSTALSPVFSVTAFGTESLGIGSPTAIIVGALLGIRAGMLISVFASYLPGLHKGRVLYNAGFAAGLAGMLINAIQKAFAIGHDKYPYEAANYTTGQNKLFALLLCIIFAYFIIAGLALGGRKNPFFKMIWHRCFGGNFIEKFGFGASLINMGTVGLLATGYTLLVGGQLNGTIFACIMTAAGFAAAGVTIREYLPTMAGVCLMALLTGGIAGVLEGGTFVAGALSKVGSRAMLLAAIYSAGLAPIVGTFGLVAGLFVGAVHSILVPNTGVLHGWMSLYNNGFSLSLIAVFLYPVYSRLPGIQRDKCVGPVD